MTQHIHSSYLPFFKDKAKFKKIVSLAVRRINKIEKEGLSFDYIACRGVSGLVIGSILALKLNKGLIVVRKQNDSTHRSSEVEGYPASGPFNYLIVDDLICEAETLNTIIRDIKLHNNSANVVGIYLYAPSCSHPNEFYGRSEISKILDNHDYSPLKL